MNMSFREMADVFVTRYALTQGVFRVRGEVTESGQYISAAFGYGKLFLALGKEAFVDEADAVKNAEDRRRKKIVALKRQLKRLEEMSFEGGDK